VFIVFVPHVEVVCSTAAIGEWGASPIEVKVIAGGARRQDSIGKGIEALPAGCEIVVVHDAARIFASHALFSKTIEAAHRTGAATAAMAPTDTVVQLGTDSEPVYIDRGSLRLIQTPQAFRASVLKEAHRKAAQDHIEGTDDASLVKRLGRKVEIVEGEISNFKITYPEDLYRAEFIIGTETRGK